MSESRLGSKRAERLTKELVNMFTEGRDFMFAELTADGPPPLTREKSPRDIYMTLVAMQQSGDPRFWNDPMAQQELARLEQQFGPAVPVSPPFPSTFPSEVI